jgi:hypothetical protein
VPSSRPTPTALATSTQWGSCALGPSTGSPPAPRRSAPQRDAAANPSLGFGSSAGARRRWSRGRGMSRRILRAEGLLAAAAADPRAGAAVVEDHPARQRRSGAPPPQPPGWWRTLSRGSSRSWTASNSSVSPSSSGERPLPLYPLARAVFDGMPAIYF